MISKTTWAIIKTRIVGEIDHFLLKSLFIMQTCQNFIKHFKIHQAPFYFLVHH